MRTRKNNGMTSVMVVLFMVVAMTVMLGLASAATTALKRTTNETSTMQTFQVANSLLEYQANLSYEQSKKNYGVITGGDFELNSLAGTLTQGATGYARVTPFGDGTWAWVTGYSHYKGKSKSIRMLIATKDVSIWNNAVFAGTGAAGQSINGNVDIRGSVHILGEGEPYSDLNGNGSWDDAEAFSDTNKNGVWDPGEPFADANNDGVWNSAEPFNDTNFNGIYDPPLTTTDLSSDLGGTAFIGNNYYNMPADLRAMIPDPLMLNGKETLQTEVRAAHGMIGISGTASLGSSTDPLVNMKGTIDGAYVSDGYSGTAGSSQVYSDNGTTNAYDLNNLDINFPVISGIGAQEYTDSEGTVWDNQQNFLNEKTLSIPITKIDATTSSFDYSDSEGNRIKYTPAVKEGAKIVVPALLEVQGIVKVTGNLAINGLSELRYKGVGTIYTTGDVYLGNDLLPREGDTFPTQSALGLIAGKNMNLATGAGDAQIKMAGAFYAQGTITSAKQNQILGTFVANYFDMGKNVPNIYQVPALAKNLPPGMPGDQPYVTIRIKSWRDRSAEQVSADVVPGPIKIIPIEMGL